MKLFKTTFLNIPVLAWLLSFITAAAMPAIWLSLFWFHLTSSPLILVIVLIALLFGGKLFHRYLGQDSDDEEEQEETNPFAWLKELVYPISFYAYVWIFLDQGPGAIAVYLLLTIFYTYDFASYYRIKPEKLEIAPSGKPWYR